MPPQTFLSEQHCRVPLDASVDDVFPEKVQGVFGDPSVLFDIGNTRVSYERRI